MSPNHDNGTPGLIFLSHSSSDKDFVDIVKSKLDVAVTFYDLKTIEPGQSTLDAMKAGVSNARVFVLFVSPNTAKSCWVGYEATLAEVRKITNPNLVVIPVVIKGAKYDDAPTWMHQYMATTEFWTASDITRHILGSYRVSLQSSGWLSPSVYEGRESEENKIIVDFLTRPTETGIPINVLIINGLEGIGRKSLARSLQTKLFAGTIPHGPIFELPDAADSIEWYLALAEDQRGAFSKDGLENQISTFAERDPSSQAEFIFNNLAHWEELNQIVVVTTRWGLRDGPGEVKNWVGHLIHAFTE